MTHIDTLREIADSFDLKLSMPIDQVPTQYIVNSQDTNLVLDLMFLHANGEKFKNYSILTDLWGPSNYTPLSVHIVIKKEFIQEKKVTIVKNSEEEKEFINKLRNGIICIDMTNILNCKKLKEITWELASIIEKLWYKHSKYVNITKYSKTW